MSIRLNLKRMRRYFLINRRKKNKQTKKNRETYYSLIVIQFRLKHKGQWQRSLATAVLTAVEAERPAVRQLASDFIRQCRIRPVGAIVHIISVLLFRRLRFPT